MVDVLFEDFEDSTLTYSGPADSLGDIAAQDYLGRVTYAQLNSIGNAYSTGGNGALGSTAYSAEDHDPASVSTGGGVEVIVLNWTSFDISGLTNLQFSGFFGEDNTLLNWDADEFVRVEVQIDGGGFVNLLEFRAEQPGGDTTNNIVRVDTNLDGIGDSGELNTTMQQFTRAISGTGSTLDLRVSIDLTAGGEDIAIDNIRVTGDGTLNADPTAVNDIAVVNEDSGGNVISVLSNDSDSDGGTPSILSVGSAASGSVVNNGSTVTYTPNADFAGSDGFTYTITDGQGGTDSATVSVTVLPQNDVPVIGNVDGDTRTFFEGFTAFQLDDGGNATVSDVDDSDFNGGSLTVSFSSGGQSEDQLSIANAGFSAGEIGVAGSSVFFGGSIIGGFTGGTNGAPLVISFTSTNATPAATAALISAIRYDNSAGDNPGGATRTVDFVVNDGTGNSNAAQVTLAVTPQDDPGVAEDDFFTVSETGSITGADVHDANGGNADSDPDTTLEVTTVNGAAFTSGAQITLGSGALLTMNTDGTFDYDPNGIFEFVPLGETATDSFTYNNAGSGSADATVTVTITGEDNRDVVTGSSGADSLDGGAEADFIQGLEGDDTINGGDGDDLIDGGAGNDTIDGGAGQDLLNATNETGPVTIDLGNFGLSSGNFAGDTVTSIEGVLGSQTDANTLTGTSGREIFIGGNSDDVISGGSGSDVLLGQGGNDTLDAGDGVDVLLGGFGDDLLIAGNKSDTFLFALNEANGEGVDVITGFDSVADQIIFYGTAGPVVTVGTATSGNVLLSYGASSSVEIDGVTEAEVNANASDFFLVV